MEGLLVEIENKYTWESRLSKEAKDTTMHRYDNEKRCDNEQPVSADTFSTAFRA